LIEEREIDASAKFVESLTHECYIVQTPLITGRLKTPLDRLLSVFEQRNFTDKSEAAKRYDYPISDEGVKEMTEILNYLGTDPEGRKELDKERYYREYLQETFGDLYAKIDEEIQKRLAKEAEMAAKDTELAAKDTELAAQQAELAELKKELERYKRQP
jgi:phage-related minor tail protein